MRRRRPELRVNTYFQRGTRSELVAELRRVCEEMGRHIPPPEDDARNAVYFLQSRWSGVGRPSWGVSMKSSKNELTVRFSARALLEVLAGTVQVGKDAVGRGGAPYLGLGDIRASMAAALEGSLSIQEAQFVRR